MHLPKNGRVLDDPLQRSADVWVSMAWQGARGGLRSMHDRKCSGKVWIVGGRTVIPFSGRVYQVQGVKAWQGCIGQALADLPE